MVGARFEQEQHADDRELRQRHRQRQPRQAGAGRKQGRQAVEAGELRQQNEQRPRQQPAVEAAEAGDSPSAKRR